MKIKRFLPLFLVLILVFAVVNPGTAQGATIGNISPKKGTGSTYLATPEAVRVLGITWGYNWNISGEEYFRRTDYEHVPMVHSGDVPDNLQYIKNLAQAFPGRYWLVFNEPDYHAQENLRPADAAVAYQQLRNAIRGADPTAKLIVGGVLWPDPTWMTGFREEYKKRYGAYPVVEGWHVHHYVEPNTYNINEWRRVPEFWKNWMTSNGGAVELWLTEFGCLVSDSVGKQIMEDQIPWLEAQPWIARYGWFNFYLDPGYWMKGTLTLPDGQLSALGQLYATFGTPPNASYAIQATAGGGGTISPSGNVAVSAGGSQAFIISPNSGFRIADVKVDGVSVGAISSKTFTKVTGDHRIEASFTAAGSYGLTIIKNGTGSGNVTSSPGGTSFAAGTVVTLTAAPDTSSSFTGWSGGCTGTALICQVTMTSDIAVTATFNLKPNTYTISATAGSNGSISPQGAIVVNAGENKTFTATPSAGYVLADVIIDGGSQGAVSPYTFNNVTANHTIAASFVQDRSEAKVIFAVNCGGLEYKDKSGVVYRADTGSNGGATYSTTAAISGTEDDILYQSERWGNFSYNIPVSNGNYSVTLKFAELYESTAGKRIFSVKIEGKEVISNLDLFAAVGKNKAYDVTIPVTVNDGTLKIEFYSTAKDAKVNAILVTSTQSPTQFSITATAGGGGTINPSGAISVVGGGQKTFTITPNAGYYTADVKVDGVSRGAASSYTFNNVTADHILIASFNLPGPNQYSLTVSKTGTGSGVVTQSPAGALFSPGTLVTLTASAEAGSVFSGWSGACSGTPASCTVTMNGNCSVEASFNKGEGSGGKGSYTSNFKLDLNGDGQTDILWQHQTRGEVFAWYMQGATFLRDEHIRTVEDTDWKVVGVGDFNGDGKADILWHHQSRGEVYVWYMDGATFLRDQYIRTVGDDLDWKIEGLGDYNGDGKVDILWRHKTRGDVYVWYMDGASFVRDQYIRSVNRVADELDWRIVN